MLTKLYNSFIRVGLTRTIIKILRFPLNPLLIKLRRKKFEKNVFALTSTEDKFTWIYKTKYWAWGNNSVSGSGSSIDYTEKLRADLPRLISTYNIKSIFDAPCGDFQWMSLVLPSLKVNYIGADIVAELVEVLNLRYKSSDINFIKTDIICERFPSADLMICRDCLFHLTYEQIQNVLINFLDSGISYLLTTTHRNNNQFLNKDIRTGDFRMIDLFSHPFNFPQNPLMRIDDWIPPEPEREMCLFSRDQILESLSKSKYSTSAH